MIDELTARVQTLPAPRAASHNDAVATLRLIHERPKIMALNFNLQRAEQCLLVHLRAPKDFILVGETRKGHDKPLRNAQQ